MVHEHDPSAHAPFTGWPAPVVPVGVHDPEAQPAPSNFPYLPPPPPASVSLYPGLFPPPPGSVQQPPARSGRGKHGLRRRRRRPPVSLIALVVIGVLAGTVVALHPGPHHDAAAGDTTVGSVSPDGSSDAGSPSSPAPSMDDSIGTPAHLPPVPKGTAFLTMGGDQGVAITPHEAATVFMGLWSMREDGLRGSSLTELKQVEDGAALASDTSVLTCRCRSFGAVKPQEVSVIVPRTTKYPAYFFGEMAADGGGAGLMYVMVMTRATADSSWHVALVSGFALDESLVGHLDASGWAGDAGEPVGADGHGFTELAALWQLAKLTGKSGDAGTFDASSWLVSDELDLLAKYPQGKPQANGLLGKVTFAKDTTVPVYGVEASAEDIVCGAIRETDTYTPAPGYAISQDAERHAFGAALQPGLYRSVTESREWQICIFGLADSSPVPIAWDPTYHAAVSGVPVPKGDHVPPDPAQHSEMPSGDGSGDSGSSAGSGGSDGSNT